MKDLTEIMEGADHGESLDIGYTDESKDGSPFAGDPGIAPRPSQVLLDGEEDVSLEPGMSIISHPLERQGVDDPCPSCPAGGMTCESWLQTILIQ